MDEDVRDFFEEFDERANLVSGARHQDFARLMRQWLRALDEAPPPISRRVSWLRALLPIERVESEVIQEGRGMVGSGLLNWPDDVEQSLSGQLNLFESLTDRDDSGWQFAHRFFHSRSRSIDDILHELTRHLFDPHVSELRRYLRKRLNNPVPSGTDHEIPASDRVVGLDHNSQAHQHTDDALQDVETKLQQINQGNPEEKNRVVAEISAARRLLQATQVRVAALVALVGSALTWIATQFAETAAGQAATWAIAKLTEYIPILAGLF